VVERMPLVSGLRNWRVITGGSGVLAGTVFKCSVLLA